MVTKIPSVIAEFKPVLQVAKIERLFGGTWACLRLTLNDDSSSIHALTAVPDALRAASCLGGIGLAPGCLLRLLEYSVTDMGSRKVVCIRASKVVAGPRALIGSGVSESEVTVQATKRARGGVAHSRDAVPARAAGPPPTEAAVQRSSEALTVIDELTTSDGGETALLQVLEIQFHAGLDPRTNFEKPWHGLQLSDGRHIILGMVTDGEGPKDEVLERSLATNYSLAEGCLVRLTNFAVETFTGRKVITVANLEVAAAPRPPIGVPMPYPRKERVPDWWLLVAEYGSELGGRPQPVISLPARGEVIVGRGDAYHIPELAGFGSPRHARLTATGDGRAYLEPLYNNVTVNGRTLGYAHHGECGARIELQDDDRRRRIG